MYKNEIEEEKEKGFHSDCLLTSTHFFFQTIAFVYSNVDVQCPDWPGLWIWYKNRLRLVFYSLFFQRNVHPHFHRVVSLIMYKRFSFFDNSHITHSALAHMTSDASSHCMCAYACAWVHHNENRNRPYCLWILYEEKNYVFSKTELLIKTFWFDSSAFLQLLAFLFTEKKNKRNSWMMLNAHVTAPITVNGSATLMLIIWFRIENSTRKGISLDWINMN